MSEGVYTSKIYDYTVEELQKIFDNSNSLSDVLRTVGLKPASGNYKTLDKAIIRLGIDLSIMEENKEKFKKEHVKTVHKKLKTPNEEIFKKNSSWQSSKVIERLVKEEIKEYKCEICGIAEWQGKPLSLQLHHIDGDRTNNEIVNLQILCPNCHSQTDNYAGKSSSKGKKIYLCPICGNERSPNATVCKKCARKLFSKKRVDLPDRKDFKKSIRENPFLQVAKDFGVGRNTVYRWCRSLGLPDSKILVDSYSDEEWDKI